MIIIAQVLTLLTIKFPALALSIMSSYLTPFTPPHVPNHAMQPTQQQSIKTAQGRFNVRVIPQPPDDGGGGPFMRVHLEKEFSGDLAGTSKGHMLGAESPVKGSGGYVLLELITGTLHGRRGSFMLQHSGYMARGAMSMKATVVPDSGTDDLIGLAGTFEITIVDGEHRYAFEYSLAQ